MSDQLPLLELKPINELLEEEFLIPSYQRGFRWTPLQVEELLNDIWEFRQLSENRSKEAFYCLQPVVVIQNDQSWEVIDGQQRLTTIYLILSYLKDGLSFLDKEKFSMEYETRPDSGEFLQQVDQEKRTDNIDYYHITEAYEAIQGWFSGKDGTAKINFLNTLLNDRASGKNVQVIWYEVGKDDAHPVEIFTRINIGKIPLTNAELIKALFLGKVNAGKRQDEDWVHLKRLQIASEWDKIENTLQNDSFWYFINDGQSNYDTRIEYIFDLMKKKSPRDEDYFTFHKFVEDFEKKDIDTIWLQVKKYFQTLEEWYNNREFYHWIGYLVTTGFATVLDLKTLSEGKTKTEFKRILKEKVKAKLDLNNNQIDELEYGDKKIKQLLLLFNIQTILANDNAKSRFPFDQFKKESWDIEHVRSVTSERPKRTNQMIEWLKLIWKYYRGGDDLSSKIELENLSKNEKKVVNKIRRVLNNKENFTEGEFIPLYNEILTLFKEEKDPEYINSVNNLALLDSGTNRAYKNAPFPVKRKYIMNKDMYSGFIPPCTKNVFLKAYSQKFDNIMYWQENDANDYVQAIKRTLTDFIQPTELSASDE